MDGLSPLGQSISATHIPRQAIALISSTNRKVWPVLLWVARVLYTVVSTSLQRVSVKQKEGIALQPTSFESSCFEKRRKWAETWHHWETNMISTTACDTVNSRMTKVVFYNGRPWFNYKENNNIGYLLTVKWKRRSKCRWYFSERLARPPKSRGISFRVQFDPQILWIWIPSTRHYACCYVVSTNYCI